jgi:glutathione synthase/RimK-type ligase-like ATP-grasp enzyme
VNVALATCAAMPDGFEADRGLKTELEAAGAQAAYETWDDPGADWDAFDLVVVRSTFDYSRRRDEFLAWADSLDGRVCNSPDVLRWNSDKRYLSDLASAGLPVVPTTFVSPGDPLPELDGEVVVKPAVSAGARDTGRFAPAAHDAARELVVDITERGRVAMVQPYLAAVDDRGETALVFLAGELSHVLRKRAVLAPDEVAPARDDEIGAAQVMYDADLVRAGDATSAERQLASAIVAAVTERFGAEPLYARVDLLAGPDGAPTLLELELVEPALYLAEAPGAAERLAAAIISG